MMGAVAKLNHTGKNIFEIRNIYFRVICLFPIFTVITEEGIVNKILFGTVILLHFLMLFSFPVKKRTVLHLGILLFSYLYTLFQTTMPILNINLLFYYPFFVLYTLFIFENTHYVEKWFICNRNYVLSVIVIWTVLVGISVFIPSCYYYKEAGARYFGSYVGTIFRLGPAAFFIQALVLTSMIFYKQKGYIFFMLLPMYCYFMGSSRTYLLIGVCLFVVSWYIFGVSKKVFYLTIIPLMIIGVFITTKSSMMDKILFSLDNRNYGNFWFRFSSSRNVIWVSCLNAWKEQPVFNKIFGSGIDFSIKTVGLWAHNDFIELLGSFGLAGVCQYLYLIVKFIKDKNIITKKTPWIVRVCITFSWFMNAFLNMHYTYFCCTLSFPFIVVAYKYYCYKKYATVRHL